jgi:hypothetical protein
MAEFSRIAAPSLALTADRECCADMTFYSAFIGWLIFNALYVLAMSWRSNPRRASD